MSEIHPPEDLQDLQAFLNELGRESLKRFRAQSEESGPLRLPELDSVIERHIEDFDEAVLLHLCAQGLHTLFDNYNFVLICTRELIRRKHIDAQLRFMDIVIAARDEYDPGHRAHENTVLDQLIETLLARFEVEPLAHLLDGLDYSVLSTDGSDGFAALFEAAFEKRREAPPTLLESLADYVNDCRSHGDDLTGLQEMLERIRTKSNAQAVKQSLEAHLKQLDKDLELETRFNTEDSTIAAELLERIGRDIPLLMATRFHVVTSLLRNHAKSLPFNALREMYLRCMSNERDARYPEVDLGRLLFPLFCNDPEAATRFSLHLAEQSGEHEFITQCVEWAIRDGAYEEQAALQAAKDCLALLKGLDPAEERAREALEDRRSSLTSQIGWALSHGNLDEARQLFNDPDNRAVLTSDMVEDIITDFSLEEKLTEEDYDGAYDIVVFDLELLDFKNENPDPTPDTDDKKLSFKARKGLQQGGVPGGFSLERFLSLALVLATQLDAQDAELIARIETLSTGALKARDDQISYAPIAYNLCCLYAGRGDKKALLEYIPIALRHGHEKEQFLNDEDFNAYLNDPEVRELLTSSSIP